MATCVERPLFCPILILLHPSIYMLLHVCLLLTPCSLDFNLTILILILWSFLSIFAITSVRM